MSLSINSLQTFSLMFLKNINSANRIVQKSLEQLSTGSKINSAADDPAGYTKLSKLNTSLSSYAQAQENTQEGLSLITVANGALESVNDDLELVREYALKASSDTLTDDQRASYQTLVNDLGNGIISTLKNTKFNEIEIFGSNPGSYTAVTSSNPDAEPDSIPTQTTKELRIQVGVDSSDSSAIIVDTGINYGDITFNLSTAEKSSETVGYLDDLISHTTKKLSNLGSSSVALTASLDRQTEAISNLTEAKSTISDADYASSMLNLLKGQMLMETNVSMLLSAQQSHKSVILNLLYGSVA